jgi:hypothetical protein
VYRATISNSIGGSPVVDFNPNQYNAATSQTQWTSSTGEVWTINTGTATTGYKGVLVNRTIVQGDGIDDLLLSGNVDLSGTNKITSYFAIKKLSTQLALFYTIGSNANRVSSLINSAVYQGFNTVGGLSNDYATVADNTSLVCFTHLTDRSLSAANEQEFYFNNIVQSKTMLNNNNTSGNLGNNPIALFARLDGAGPSNNILNTAISSPNLDNSTQRTAMYNYVRSINNNAF